MRRLTLLFTALVLLVAPTADAARRGGPPGITVGDYTNVQAGPWTGYLAPTTSGGVAYTQAMTYQPGSFPAGTTIAWSYPTGSPAAAGIYGFDAISFGNYYGTAALAPITPRQVKTITTLTQTLDSTIAGSTTGFNVILDVFLTAASGNFTNRLIEIDWQLHASASARAYIVTLTNRGTWKLREVVTFDLARHAIRFCALHVGRFQ